MALLRFGRPVLGVLSVCALFACGGSTSTQGPGPGPAGTTTPPPDGQPPAATCSEGASDVAVVSEDLNGYPPYASSGCTLAYVSTSGALVLRDLATKNETVLAPAAERPRRPALSSDLVAWEAEEGGVRVVRAYVRTANAPAAVTVKGRFTMAGEPRVNGHAMVFTAWQSTVERSDTDVWIYDALTGEAKLAIGGAAQQRFADISAKVIVATDFAEDADGFYDGSGGDLADIVVVDRATGQITKRAAPGKQAFPMLGDDDLLAYLEWGTVHPEPKLVAYDLKVGPLFGQPAADRTIANVTYMSSEYARPAVAGRMLEWVANPDGRTALYRAPLDGSSAPVRVSGLDDLQLFAPAPSSGFTVLATSPRAGAGGLSPKLRGVVR